jgi:hypothetical protein
MGGADSNARSLDLPPDVHARIEIERRRLQKASAVLAVLVFAANHDAPDVDAGDVASAAQLLIDLAIEGLDIVSLLRE